MLILGVLAGGWWLKQQGLPKLNPELAFTTINGEPLTLNALAGEPVVVTFWATDCPACLAEIPHWLELYRQYHCAGLEIIAISMPYDPPNHVVEMVKARHIPYPVVLDIESIYTQAFGNIAVTPTTFLIGPDGNVVWHRIGSVEPALIKNYLSTYLKDRSCSG